VNVTLRSLQPADYEAIALWVSDPVACLRCAGPRLTFPVSAAELPALLAVDGGESYCLAEGAATPYGFGQHWVLPPGAVHLGRIILSPVVRGKGLGRVLCLQLVTKAIQCTGANAITLRVYRDNAAAVALYTGRGFAPVESESAEDVLFMRASAAHFVYN
jgi:ribosomal protein S18 acetylase RimI-like enzyme